MGGGGELPFDDGAALDAAVAVLRAGGLMGGGGELPFDDDAALDAAVAVLRAGGLLVYPTETVYGIGTALSAGEAGIEAVRRAKGSPPGRPFLLLVASVGEALGLWDPRPAGPYHLWPGPVTLVGPARAGLPPSLLGREGSVHTVSVRVPGDERLRELLRRLGEPLLSTSANPATAAPPVAFEDVDLAALRPDLALDGGRCREGLPSTLLSLLFDPPRLLRPGAAPWPGPGQPTGP